jgi:predicted negative regulator of RcsB-dependent stress response
MGNEIESIKHLERYAIGCSDPKAAEIYKECGDGYLNLGKDDKAVSNYKLALEKNPKSPVKSKIQALQK